MEKPVIIFGAKGIAKSALEIFESNGVVVYGFLDEDKSLHGQEIGNIPILGDPEDHGYLKLLGQKCEAFVATDDNQVRKDQVDYLMEQRKVMPTNAVHQQAYISKSASIGHGNFINSRATIGANSSVGQHCIISSGVTIEHDVTLQDFVQVGAGSTINAGVEIKKNAFIGSGVTIVAGVTIGKGARVGAGSVVIGAIADGETVFGNPATNVKK
ncbi:MAG: acetyltransferase [Cyclobacteriaceae bacterium]|nr:acetyltransferase [Cyclobacteriaceae bacterium HetDA_MAG_MS6]